MNSEFAKKLAAIIKANAPLPEFFEELSLDDAYRLQHEVTQVRTEGDVGGIKAGVTSPAFQQFFGLRHALLGSLYADGQREGGCTLPYLEGRAIECEVAVLLDRYGRPIGMAPAFEIVFLKFSRPDDMTAANLVASNLGADLYIVGEMQDWDEDFPNTPIVLRCNGDVVNETSTAEAIGGPQRASVWMWQEARSRGFSVGDKTLLLTGACGSLVPAQPGYYEADFGPLGRVGFEVAA
ncbi:MAG: hypothetical protein ISN29_05480 [Gammaproteobacteria bacterium AqS3]|nr:hypothetical protein [Gammaproteobacteria bacterium AqS3]